MLLKTGTPTLLKSVEAAKAMETAFLTCFSILSFLGELEKIPGKLPLIMIRLPFPFSVAMTGSLMRSGELFADALVVELLDGMDNVSPGMVRSRLPVAGPDIRPFASLSLKLSGSANHFTLQEP